MRIAALIVCLLACCSPALAARAPDFQGVWSNASVTKLTRPSGVPHLVATPAEARALAAPWVEGLAQDSAPTDPKAGPPPYGADPGGANAFWGDAGSSLARINGQFRTSWIVDPADGQLPFSEAGKALRAKAAAFARAAERPADPEALQPWDRCLISSRGSGGPGMLNNIYNSNVRIVQTPGFVAITVEMIHDVRIIPLFPSRAAAQAGHRPAVIQPWLGDSVGWWEGRTLVVETLHVNPEQGRAGPIYLTPQGRVTERFRRLSPHELFYEFRVEDPAYYSQPWRAEMVLTATPHPMYEYACHEGNYALANILRGARAEDARTGAHAVARAPALN